ncbi:acyltransferase domain-containing protein [Nocardia abscessus]|uniref:Acyltransferase domain-containing protein n=1 Tax=Nocardia abscessus TaxID=120957 RepID=A0ABS0CBR7_9NOCA|nr:type I polyketide synthase [Nocardia abscessus]MBF6227806.1 acyltransferase domain-containing protein [Nocardia abscessus]
MTDEPIAVIGVSCRFAHAVKTPEDFWNMLREGRDAVGEPSAERWAPYHNISPRIHAILSKATRHGCYLDDVAGFDATFFGISPREAIALDPQQRILLELSWEALERAGIPPDSLRGTDTSVFMAGTTHDYSDRMITDLPRLDAWAVNGTYAFGLANRISYTLDLHGASIAIDTACAGSLTTVQLACQHLWRRESNMALVGGVNVIGAPGPAVALAAAGATSAYGRSKSFDAEADGYGRGEGAGVVVLKRLDDALRDHDPVLAVVRGCGVFHDGTGAGIMVPNGVAQEKMLRRIYERFDIPLDSIDYIEAHATGTPIGDPIELGVLADVFGARRAAGDPCFIGSVKPNIGHLEAGAGIAALIKTVLALRYRALPASLHTRLTQAIDWESSGLSVVNTLRPWPNRCGPRRAGISAFGVGGTIAHLIVEEAPQQRASGREDQNCAQKPPYVVPLSAASETGLRAQALALAQWLEGHPYADLNSVGHTLALRRSHLAERTAVVVTDLGNLTRSLRSVAECSHMDGSGCGRSRGVVWVFSGHGAQWAGMGQGLLDHDMHFTEVIDRLGPIYDAELGLTPRKAIMAGDWSSTVHVQAMTFAMQAALIATWQARGVRPAAVVGHSLGEIAAALAAGSIDLDSAARFACRRALLVEQVAGGGAMTMVNITFEDAEERLRSLPNVWVAIASAPEWTVVSGSRDAVAAAEVSWKDEGLVVRRIETDVAFHSPYMDPLVADTVKAGGHLAPQPPDVPMYSSVGPDPRTTRARDGSYYGATIREPVRFRQAVQAAIDDGYRVFLEVSSHPIVAHSISEMLERQQIEDSVVAHSLYRRHAELNSILTNLALLYCHSVPVDWSGTFNGGSLVDLPTVQWQHRPFWLQPPVVDNTYGGHDPESHTLLGTPLTVSGMPDLHVWQSTLDFSSRPYPGEHRLQQTEVLPGAIYFATLFAAAIESGMSHVVLTDVDLRAPLTLNTARTVQVVVNAGAARLSSCPVGSGGAITDSDSWHCHLTAGLGTTAQTEPQSVDLNLLRARCTIPTMWQEVEDRLLNAGLGGHSFDWIIEEVSRGPNAFLAVVSERNAQPATDWAPLIDATLNTLQLLSPDDDLRLLAGVGRAEFWDLPVKRAFIYGSTDHDGVVSLSLISENGKVLVQLAEVKQANLGELIVTPPKADELAHNSTHPSNDTGMKWDFQGGDRLAELKNDLRNQVSVELGMRPEEVTSARPLGDIGLDSVLAIRLRTRLSRRYGLELPPTLLWDHPTLADIGGYIDRHLP